MLFVILNKVESLNKSGGFKDFVEPFVGCVSDFAYALNSCAIQQKAMQTNSLQDSLLCKRAKQ